MRLCFLACPITCPNMNVSKYLNMFKYIYI
jgi:hypothetical protein